MLSWTSITKRENLSKFVLCICVYDWKLEQEGKKAFMYCAKQFPVLWTNVLRVLFSPDYSQKINFLIMRKKEFDERWTGRTKPHKLYEGLMRSNSVRVSFIRVYELHG